jgi:hypothetical protein
LVFILIPLIGNNIRACHAFHHHVLALEADVGVLTKVFKPLIIVSIPEVTHLVVNIDDENSPVDRQPKRLLDCE